jgi:rRNA maturation protein Nop10
MTSRRTFIGSMLTLAAVPLLSNGQTCSAAAKKDAPAACAAKFTATGAAVVESNEKKTKIKITCPKCGKVAELEIDTPTADKPYALDWVCPKCGCKVKVSVVSAKA